MFSLKAIVPTRIKHSLKRNLSTAKIALVGTHHKTGTVWLKKIFREIAHEFGLTMVSRREDESPPTPPYDIFFIPTANSRNSRGLSTGGYTLLETLAT